MSGYFLPPDAVATGKPSIGLSPDDAALWTGTIPCAEGDIPVDVMTALLDADHANLSAAGRVRSKQPWYRRFTNPFVQRP